MFSLPLILYAVYVPIIFAIYLIQVIIVIVNKQKPQFRSSYFTLFIIEAFTVNLLIRTISKLIIW